METPPVAAVLDNPQTQESENRKDGEHLALRRVEARGAPDALAAVQLPRMQAHVAVAEQHQTGLTRCHEHAFQPSRTAQRHQTCRPQRLQRRLSAPTRRVPRQPRRVSPMLFTQRRAPHRVTA
eukprot:2973313-Rhodomonas_salina.1